MRRVTWRLLPFLLLLYVISWLDRVNVGFAKLQMNSDLSLSETAYGLGAGIWTQSVKRAHGVARRIRAGTVWVNTYRAVSFLMPFGGYKASGLGRENGAEAIEGYLQTKSVWINNGPGGGNPFVMKTAS